MTEETLKTLKDIETRICTPQMLEAATHKDLVRTIGVFDLRKEAIKWIKKLEEFHGFYILFNGIDRPYDWKDIQAIISWIKHVFNIEESDLK